MLIPENYYGLEITSGPGIPKYFWPLFKKKEEEAEERGTPLKQGSTVHLSFVNFSWKNEYFDDCLSPCRGFSILNILDETQLGRIQFQRRNCLGPQQGR